MKIWKQIKYPLIVALTVLIILALRIVLPALSYNWGILFYFRLFLVLFSRDFFHADWVLWDLILLITMVWVIMVIPATGRLSKPRRFLLRPLLAVAIFVFLTPLATNAIEDAQAAVIERERQQSQKQTDETYANIHAFVEDADVAYVYNTSTHHMNHRFKEEFPQLLLTHDYYDNDVVKIGYHYCDYLLIDYDTLRIAFIYTKHGRLTLFEYQLSPADTYPTTGRQKTIQLDAPGASLMSYRPGPTLQQYTDGFALTMSDGSIYTITGLCENGNLFLNIQRNDFKKIENFPE